MTKITIIGAGGHAKVVADAILADGTHEISGFLDDDETLWGTALFGIEVSGPIRAWRHGREDAFIVGLGENSRRKLHFDQLRSAGASPVTIVHPRATIARGVSLGDGVVIFANAVVNCDTRIGDNCILNTGCIVDHDCVVEAHAHAAPGATIAGKVRLGEGAFIGTGANIVPGVHVGGWGVVGSGAVVTRDVDRGAVVVGVPARPVRRGAP